MSDGRREVIRVEDETGDRGRILRALREAGEKGMTSDELGAGGRTGIHIESLRHEGHRIEQQRERAGLGRWRTRYWLREDAWA